MTNLVLHIFNYICFQILRSILIWIEKILWHFDGTCAQIQAAKDVRNYEHSARVSAIKKHFHFDAWGTSNKEANFITRHQGFVHPEYALKDEVSLYCLTDDKAFFVEAPSGVEVWRNKYSAFHRIAQHQNAVKLISMPISSFFRLSEHIGDTDAKLIFIDFVPRSGSTLLGQIFEATGVCVNYAEVDFTMNYIFNLDKPNFSKNLRAMIRFYTKPRRDPTQAFIFKTLPFGQTLSPWLHDLYPGAYFFHLTRNAIPNLKSLNKAHQAIPLHRVWAYLCSLPVVGGLLEQQYLGIYRMDGSKFREIFKDTKTNMDYYIWAQIHHLYLINRQNLSHDKPAIKYEDLTENKRENVLRIFKHCGLDADLVDKALEAFEKDAQAGSALGRDNLQEIHHDPQLLKVEKKISDRMGFGEVQSDFRIEGTVTTGP